jgi:hypothetical protein
VAPLGIGHWHTADWFGAVLTASEIVAKASATEQVELVNRFADDSLAALGTHPKETGT